MIDPKLVRFLSFMLTLAICSAALGKTGFSRGPTGSARPDGSMVAPANDNFANAELLMGNSGNVTGSTITASKESGEPAHARNRGGASIWYKYVAPGNGVLTLDTTGSGFDTTLAVYKGSSLASLNLVAANNNALVGISSRVTVGTQLNDVLYIAVDGHYSSSTGVLSAGNLSMTYTFGNVANNDNFANPQILSAISGSLLTTTNVGASKESGEPTSPYGNNGGKSLWYRWIAPSSGSRSFTFAFESLRVAGSGGVRTLVMFYSGTNFANFQLEQYGTDTNRLLITFIPDPGKTYYFSLDGWDDGAGAQTGTFTINWGITKDAKMADFDRDGRADITVFRPSTGAWYTIDSVTDSLRTAQFGANGDKPILTDMGVDSQLDYAVFRPDTGYWYFNDTELGFKAVSWGLSGDVPLALQAGSRNFFAIFRPINGLVCRSSYVSGFCFGWGTSGDIPMYAGFSGSGADTFTVFRPSNGTWYFNSSSPSNQPVKFGQNGDRPVPADYDGDGITDVAVFRPSTGVWYILRSSNGSVSGVQWGVSGDVPQPADYDGDGLADIAVFRNGSWYIRESIANSFRAVQFGQAGDIPVTAPVR